MAGIKIKRNDTVEVIAGKDKGKQGRVLRVIADKDRLLVEHVMMIKKHVKPNPQRNIAGGILTQEAPIHISNVSLLDSVEFGVAVGFDAGDGESRIRRRGRGGTGGDVKCGLWGRQANHDGLNEVGDLFWRRRRLRPECDNPVESFGVCVEGDDAVIGFNEPPCHRKTHVAQADKPNVHYRLPSSR